MLHAPERWGLDRRKQGQPRKARGGWVRGGRAQTATLTYSEPLMLHGRAAAILAGALLLACQVALASSRHSVLLVAPRSRLRRRPRRRAAVCPSPALAWRRSVALLRPALLGLLPWLLPLLPLLPLVSRCSAATPAGLQRRLCSVPAIWLGLASWLPPCRPPLLALPLGSCCWRRLVAGQPLRLLWLLFCSLLPLLLLAHRCRCRPRTPCRLLLVF